MNSDKIESMAVRKIWELIDNNPYLNHNLSISDKEPSWDGSIYVYDDSSSRKQSMLGRVPIQIKGTTTIDLSKRGFPIKTVDLNNYLKDGGVLYLTVNLNNSSNQVYYKQLLPIDIKQLLSNKGEQKTINVKMNLLPLEIQEQMMIFKGFIETREREMSFISQPLVYLDKILDSDYDGSIRFVFSGKSHLDIFDKAKRGEVRIYSESSTSPIPVPIVNKIENLIIYEEEKTDITVNGKVFYEFLIRKREDINQVSLHFGQSFELKINPDTMSGQIKIQLTKNLLHITRDFEFITEFIKYRKIEMFGYPIVFDDKKLNQEVLKKIENEYQLLKNVKKLWEKWGLDLDFDLDALTRHQLTDLITIADSIVNKTPIKPKNENDQHIYLFSINNFDLLFIAIPKNDGYIFYDFFDVNELDSKTFDMVRIQSFITLNTQQLKRLYNFNIENIILIYKRYYEKQPNLRIEYLLLKLIDYSDYLEDNIKIETVLKMCLVFSEWILDLTIDGNDLSNLLNLYQVKYRLRMLSSDDNHRIIQLLADESIDTIFKFGAAVLLKNLDLASTYFQSIPEDEKDNIKKLPIFSLYKKLTTDL